MSGLNYEISELFSNKISTESSACSSLCFEALNSLFYLYGVITSEKIGELDFFLNWGLGQIKSYLQKAREADVEILELMKEAIFNSGDVLADFISKKGLPIDDVDYAIVLLCFRSNVLYVWVDGELNVKIFRGEESLLLNSSFKPQFWGSGFLEDGDRIVIGPKSLWRDLEGAHGTDYEGLENLLKSRFEKEYSFVALEYKAEGRHKYLDNLERSSEVERQKMGESSEEVAEEVKQFVSIKRINNKVINKNVKTNATNESLNSGDVGVEEEYVDKKDNSESLLNSFKNYIKDKFSQIDSNKVVKFISKLNAGIVLLMRYYFALISQIVDWLFSFIYGAKTFKYKRFKDSAFRSKVIKLTGLLVLILIIFNVFRLLLVSKKESEVEITNFKTASEWLLIKSDLDSKYEKLVGFVNTMQVEDFEYLRKSLLDEIESLKSNSAYDQEYLNKLYENVQRQEDVLYKNVPVTKVDEIYTTDHLGEVNLVDFSRVGNVVYALDQANSRILISNSQSQSMTIFVTISDYKKLNYISCSNKECYLLDEERGFAILNLETKRVSRFSSLANAGRNVKDMEIFRVGDLEYIYTLIPSESKVLRYPRIGEGIGQPEVWNKEEGFGSETVDILVDGSIYELGVKGKIRRFYAGRLDSATFNGFENVPLGLSGEIKMAATPPRDPAPGVINRLYVSDPSNARIVVFDRNLNSNKKMEFLGAFKYRGNNGIIQFNNISEITLSSDEKYLYCLTKKVIFKISVTDLF